MHGDKVVHKAICIGLHGIARICAPFTVDEVLVPMFSLGKSLFDFESAITGPSHLHATRPAIHGPVQDDPVCVRVIGLNATHSTFLQR